MDIPANAKLYLPVLIEEYKAHWPTIPIPVALPAQIEQETCITLKHSKCWSPRAELKTQREYGFGLGQLTVTSRFNAFSEVKTYDQSLKTWKWEERYEPKYQLRALVIKDRFNYDRISLAANTYEQLAFALAAYNGGLGGVISDRKVCRATAGCDPSKWFKHVETTSLKNKIKVKGYGKSFFEINREYVTNILQVRLTKYKLSLGGSNAK